MRALTDIFTNFSSQFAKNCESAERELAELRPFRGLLSQSETRVRQLTSVYEEVRTENEKLFAQLQAANVTERSLRKQLATLDREILRERTRYDDLVSRSTVRVRGHLKNARARTREGRGTER